MRGQRQRRAAVDQAERKSAAASGQKPAATVFIIPPHVAATELNNKADGVGGSVFFVSTGSQGLQVIIMVALCNTADHYIFALWFLSFFFLPSFLA